MASVCAERGRHAGNDSDFVYDIAPASMYYCPDCGEQVCAGCGKDAWSDACAENHYAPQDYST